MHSGCDVNPYCLICRFMLHCTTLRGDVFRWNESENRWLSGQHNRVVCLLEGLGKFDSFLRSYCYAVICFEIKFNDRLQGWIPKPPEVEPQRSSQYFLNKHRPIDSDCRRTDGEEQRKYVSSGLCPFSSFLLGKIGRPTRSERTSSVRKPFIFYRPRSKHKTEQTNTIKFNISENIYSSFNPLSESREVAAQYRYMEHDEFISGWHKSILACGIWLEADQAMPLTLPCQKNAVFLISSAPHIYSGT